MFVLCDLSFPRYCSCEVIFLIVLCCVAYLVSNFEYEDHDIDRSTKLSLFKFVDAVLERFSGYRSTSWPLISNPCDRLSTQDSYFNVMTLENHKYLSFVLQRTTLRQPFVKFLVWEFSRPISTKEGLSPPSVLTLLFHTFKRLFSLLYCCSSFSKYLFLNHTHY